VKQRVDFEKTRILDLSMFKKTGKASLYEKREVEVAPSEFREFPYKKETSSEVYNAPDSDDIIGNLLNEFSEELESTNYHQEEKALHFFTLKPQRNYLEAQNMQQIIDGLSHGLNDLQENCSRVRHLVAEIENQLQTGDNL
jgi:hypothetical protein